MEVSDSAAKEKWSGTQYPKYSEESDKEHEIVAIDQQLVISNGEPAISLQARCTCGWHEERTVYGEPR